MPDNEKSKPKAKSKFDIKSLRVSQDFEPATTPAFEYIYLGKPSKRTFFRDFTIPAKSERYWLVEDFTNELYLATPKLALVLSQQSLIPCDIPGSRNESKYFCNTSLLNGMICRALPNDSATRDDARLREFHDPKLRKRNRLSP